MIIAGAGIVGLAHAYLAAKAGRSVAVFERSHRAMGASVRNFGMVWPIGQPPGHMLQMALESREIWVEILKAARLPFRATGSLHAVYREDEAAVAREFASKAPALGYQCEWLPAEQTLHRSQALQPANLLGALWSPTELTVDPRVILRVLPQYLAERFGVRFYFGTAVQSIDLPQVVAGGQRWKAEQAIVCAGDDFETLYPECFRESGITRCKLQMMRTVPQPDAWELGPSLAFGLTFRHYHAFEICQSLQALKHRVSEETPEYDRWGIHVLVSQTASGELTLGDSHDYGLAVDIFDNPAIDRAILDYTSRYLAAPSLQIQQTWHGVYARHPTQPYLRFHPAPGVSVVTVTSGIGMTLSFGLARETQATAS